MRFWWLVLGLVVALQVDPQPIQRIAAAERAFSAAAAEQGWRDAALAFVAPDAVTLQLPAPGLPLAVPLRPEIEARSLTKLPVALREMWDPMTGAVSGDGELGWMIGPRAALNLPTRSLANQGAFFHLWRHQPDGTWKLWLDDDVRFPDVWQTTDSFTAVPVPDAGTSGPTDESLADAERAIANGGTAWIARLSAAVRVLRAGRAPIASREAAVTWAASGWNLVRFADAVIVSPDSDDMGVAYGSYTLVNGAAQERGTWIRAWQRDVAGRWRIMFETSQPRRPSALRQNN
jgi:hypothetical protein